MTDLGLRRVLSVCFCVASLRDADFLLLMVTALRNTRCCSHPVATPFLACTVLFKSHPAGVNHPKSGYRRSRGGYPLLMRYSVTVLQFGIDLSSFF